MTISTRLSRLSGYAARWFLVIPFVTISLTAFGANDLAPRLNGDFTLLEKEAKAPRADLTRTNLAMNGARPRRLKAAAKPSARELPIPLGKMEKQLRSLSRTVGMVEEACPRCRSAREMARRVKALTGSVKALAQAKNRRDRPEAVKILHKMCGTLGTIENHIGRLASEMRKQIQPKPGRGKIKRMSQSGKPLGASQLRRTSGVGDDAQLGRVDIQDMLQKQQQLIQALSNISKLMHDTAMAIIRKIR